MSFFIEVSEIDKNANYKIVNPKEYSGLNQVNADQLIQFSEESGLNIQILNDRVSPIIVALKDKQKFEYEQKKAKKEQEKRSKANAQKSKEIKFHPNISENDIQTKINKIREFLSKNCKVKLVMEMRGREVNMDSLAKDKFNSILENLNSFKLDEIKKFGPTFFTFVSK